MKKFKLWMGCLGNGITVCNSAVEESGDYKHIAHISDSGKIKLYVSESYIPVEDMQRIERTATEQRKTFLNEWNKQPDIRKYENTLSYLNEVSEDKLKEETTEGEELRKRLIYQDYINRGFSQERATKEVKRSIDSGNDIEDAKEALNSNKEYFKS